MSLSRMTHYPIDTNGVAKNNFARLPTFATSSHCHKSACLCSPVNPYRLHLVGRTTTLLKSNMSVVVGLPPYSADVLAHSRPAALLAQGFINKTRSKVAWFDSQVFPTLFLQTNQLAIQSPHLLPVAY